MVEKKVTIKNEMGIHCRPSTVIMTAATREFPGHEFTIVAGNGMEAGLGSILGLISLGLAHGDSATVRVSGPNEAAACERIAELMENEFDFPPA